KRARRAEAPEPDSPVEMGLSPPSAGCCREWERGPAGADLASSEEFPPRLRAQQMAWTSSGFSFSVLCISSPLRIPYIRDENVTNANLWDTLTRAGRRRSAPQIFANGMSR